MWNFIAWPEIPMGAYNPLTDYGELREESGPAIPLDTTLLGKTAKESREGFRKAQDRHPQTQQLSAGMIRRHVTLKAVGKNGVRLRKIPNGQFSKS